MGCFHLRGQKEYNDWQQIVADNGKVDGAGVGGRREVETQIKNVIPAFCSSYFVSFIKSFIFHEGILYLYVSN